MRKKIQITSILILLTAVLCQAQEQPLNWLIFVDDQVPKPSQLWDEKLILLQQEDSTEISVKYLPGSLEFTEEEWSKLKAVEADSIHFKFKYFDFDKKGERRTYDYSIPISKGWFPFSYVYIKIYNLKRRKCSPSEVAYTFEINTPNFSILKPQEK